MEISKLKLEIYDFLGIIIPGLLMVCEGMILVRGWPAFMAAISRVNGIGLTLLILLAFGVGNITQELGDIAMRAVKGKRYARAGRDTFWLTDESKMVKAAIQKESGLEIELVDTAYDYCLTRIMDRFPKRDLFVGVSDMCRSFVVLSALAIIPAARIAFHDMNFARTRCSVGIFALLMSLLFSIASLAWKRMVRFRDLSETTVFRVYLAVANEPTRRD